MVKKIPDNLNNSEKVLNPLDIDSIDTLEEAPVANSEQSSPEKTVNQSKEETLENWISELRDLDQMIEGGEKKNFFKKFFGYFNRDQKRAEKEINEIAKKEGRDLVDIKNESKNHEDKYAANMLLARDILKNEERVTLLETQKKKEDAILLDKKKKHEHALKVKKDNLPQRERLSLVEEALVSYNEIYQKIGNKRFEIATSICKVEAAMKNLSEKNPEIRKIMREEGAEKLSELKKQQLEIDLQYKKLRQRISLVQSDRLNIKYLVDKIENIGKTDWEIADDIRAKRAKQEAEAKARQEADKKEIEEKAKEDKTKDETQVETKAEDNKNNNEAESDEGVDIEKLNEYLNKAELNLSGWCHFIKRMNKSYIYNGLYNFVRDDNTKRIDIKKDEINGLKIREMMIAYLMRDGFLNKEGATRVVNEKLDKIREHYEPSSSKVKQVFEKVKEEENTAPAENNITETKQPAKVEEEKEKEIIDIKELNKKLEKTNKSLGGWNGLIDNSDFSGISDFAKQKSIVFSNKNKINGIKYRELMIDFLVENKKNKKKKAKEEVDKILYGKIIKK